MSPARRPLADRFWEKVDRNGPVPPHRPELGACWVWTRATNGGGYGKIGSGAGGEAERTLLAPRVSWDLANGPIPDGLWVLHHCDNPPCVRPDHLFLGTAKDNTRDMIGKGRKVRGDISGPRNPRHGAAVSADTRAKIGAASAKAFYLLDPDGNPIEIVNLTRFCRDCGFNVAGMHAAAVGRKRSYKGYVKYERIYRAGLAAGLTDVSDPPEGSPSCP